MWVFVDGQFKRYKDANVGLLTHALHYGTGIFEGLRAYWHDGRNELRILRPGDHFARMRVSARVIGAELPYAPDELTGITVELLRRNEFRNDVYVRPILFAASEEVGVRLHDLRFTFAICAVPIGRYLDTANGIRCVVSSWRRVSDSAIPARAKITGAYVNSALAKSEAVRRGYDEAITLTTDGSVAEGSAENIFIVRNGTLATPPISDDILEGVTRQLLMTFARTELGREVVERSIDRTELYAADEILLCGTGAEIAGVVEIDDRVVGAGQPGAITRELQRLYISAARGEIPKYADWSVPVPSGGA